MMLRRVVWLVALTVGPALANAQDTARADLLRAEIERRFADRVRVELGLNDDQVTRLKATQERFGPRRRDVMRRQAAHRLALQWQMRPGVAADPESVRVHMDGLQAGRAEMLKLEQDEDREMAGYLTPVQRARFQFMRQRFLERVNEMRVQRQQRGGRPGMRRPPGGGSRRP